MCPIIDLVMRKQVTCYDICYDIIVRSSDVYVVVV